MGMAALQSRLEQIMDAMTQLSYAPISPAKTPFVNSSISSATGSSQVIAAANPDRQELVLFNLSNKQWWINPTGGTAAADTAGNILLEKGGVLTLDTTSAVTGIGTAGKALTVLER